MSRISVLALAAPLLVVLLSAALPVQAETQPDPRLNGNWQLDTQASDSFDDKLAKLAEAMRAKRRSRNGGYGGGGGGGGRGGGRDPREVPPLMDELPPESRDEMGDRLGETYRPPAHLHIDSDAESVSVRGDAPSTRRFNLLETVTRMDVSGTASIRSDWTSKGFTVDSRYTNRSRSMQRYTVDRTGAVLTVTLELTEPISGKLQVHSVYRRATP